MNSMDWYREAAQLHEQLATVTAERDALSKDNDRLGVLLEEHRAEWQHLEAELSQAKQEREGKERQYQRACDQIARLTDELAQAKEDALWAMRQLHFYMPSVLDTEASKVQDRITQFLKEAQP
jgi:chromosome segregation ATPase